MRSEVFPIFLSLSVVYMLQVVYCLFQIFFVHAGVKQLLSRCLTDFTTDTSFDLDQLRCRRLCYIFVLLFPHIMCVLPLP